jgi:hypothetical protein
MAFARATRVCTPEDSTPHFTFRNFSRTKWQITVLMRLGLLVPISAKKTAAGCDFVRQREEKDLRKLHGAARLRKARKKSGGFDSLHPLQSMQMIVRQLLM